MTPETMCSQRPRKAALKPMGAPTTKCVSNMDTTIASTKAPMIAPRTVVKGFMDVPLRNLVVLATSPPGRVEDRLEPSGVQAAGAPHGVRHFTRDSRD